MKIFDLIKNNNSENSIKLAMSMTNDKNETTKYSYGEMFNAVDVFAQKLISAGIKSGDRIVIVAPNSPEWNISYLAAMKLHCTAVLVDASLPPVEILRLIDNSDARCVFTSSTVVKNINQVISTTIPVLNVENQAEPFINHLDKISSEVSDTIDGDAEVAFIIYSSGTTKTATGIMHTHESMIGATHAAIKFNNLQYDEKMLVVIPNSHIYGVITSMLGPLFLGGTMHFIESMTGENVLKAFKEFQPTVFSCVPRVFETFQKQILIKIHSKKFTSVMYKAFSPICYSLRMKFGFNLGKIIFKSIHEGFGGHIRIFCAAGAPLNAETTKFYFGVGLNLFLNYGLTETNVPILANGFDNYTVHSCGKKYPDVEFKLVNLDDSDKRELYIKTPFMMKGYFRDEQATKEAFSDGWFKTGDISTIDKDNNISVVGRCKDNIVLANGKKVTPDDIELQFADIENVTEFVVCGVTAKSGDFDEVHAFVVCDSQHKQSVEDAINEKSSDVSQYMKISKIHFVPVIPKTSLQKPKRYVLKKSVMAEVVEAPILSVNKSLNVEETLISLIQRVQMTDKVITAETQIFSELGLDSLKGIELDLLINETFNKNVSEFYTSSLTFKELVNVVENQAESTKSTFNKIFPVKKQKFDYFCFKFYCTLVKWVYKVNYTGLENLPKEGGYIICPNHQSNFDFLYVTMKFGKDQFQKLGCMAKQELIKHTRTTDLLARVCGMIPIDRDNQNAQAVALCKQKLKEGWNFLIYPEGTRTKTGEIGEFKKGAAMIAVSENVPIIPVKIKGGFEIFPAGHKLPKLFDFKNMRRLRVEVAFASPLTGFQMDIDGLTKKLKDTIVNL